MTEQDTHSEPEALLRRQTLVRSRDLEGIGISRTRIRRMLADGTLERVGHGLYRSPTAELSERADIAQAARRVPNGVICLLSALRFHRLTTQNPFEVWMAIGVKAWRPNAQHPPLRLIYLTGSALQEGVEEHQVDGVPVRVFGAAKTVVDCFRFRNKIGIDIAVEALREYRRAHPRGLDAVWRFAGRARMAKVMTPYLEAQG